jgi:hypothetical protein
MSVDDPNDTSTWTTFWVKIWHGDPVDLKGQEALNYIKENTAPLRGIFQSAIDWTPDGSYVSINEMKYWVPTPWNNYGGRVTLAGDAAHPMLICKYSDLTRYIWGYLTSIKTGAKDFSTPSPTLTTT